MKVIIIEDEQPAIDKLESCLKAYDNSINIVAKLSTVKQSIEWLSQNMQSFDLAFMDIRLTDGLSFDIFKSINFDKPIVFVTAYDAYTLNAFEVHSIGYLLKPISLTELTKTMNKLKTFKLHVTAELLDSIQHGFKKSSKDRFLVKLGQQLHAIETNEIDFFHAEGRTVFLTTKVNKKFILDYTLEELEELLDDEIFFRINRSVILNIDAIQNVVIYGERRLKVILIHAHDADQEFIVSRGKVVEFKSWFEGKF